MGRAEGNAEYRISNTECRRGERTATECRPYPCGCDEGQKSELGGQLGGGPEIRGRGSEVSGRAAGSGGAAAATLGSGVKLLCGLGFGLCLCIFCHFIPELDDNNLVFAFFRQPMDPVFQGAFDGLA